MNNILKKILVLIIPIISLGLVTPESLPDTVLPTGYIKKESPFKAGSNKAKINKIVTILWAVIFFSFGAVIIVAMMDSFFINRAILVKYLTRTALSLLVVIFITDGIMAFVKE